MLHAIGDAIKAIKTSLKDCKFCKEYPRARPVIGIMHANDTTVSIAWFIFPPPIQALPSFSAVAFLAVAFKMDFQSHCNSQISEVGCNVAESVLGAKCSPKVIRHYS